jgi:FixJ family two-component response regulator
MDALRPVVFVVDDDPSVCQVLTHLLRSVGLTVRPYASALGFLGAERSDVPSCLVLEVRLPDLSGLELQHQLAEAQVALPLIFLTAHGTIPLAVRAMKAGAREFLSKPVNEHAAEDCCLTKLRRFPCSAEPEGVKRPYALCKL